MGTKTVVVDGISIETTDQGAEAIEKLRGQLQTATDAAATAATDHTAEVERLKGEHATAIADKDKAIGAKDTEITELKAQVPDAAALDALANARADLIGKASKLAKDADFAGKSNAEIKAIAVDAVHGAGFSKDKPEAWIDGAFDAAKVPEGSGDAFRDAMASRTATDRQVDDHGYADYVASLNGGDATKKGE